MKVLGLDVSKSSVVGCLLETVPADPKQYYDDTEFPVYTNNAAGLKALLALQADVVVLEPTGVNYSRVWNHRLSEAGCTVVQVGHRQLVAYRETLLNAEDKDDPADALSLCCYYFQHCDTPRRFVRIREPIINQIRELVLRLNHLNRVQSPIINRAKQDLAWQFPERMHTSLEAPLFWGWLAGTRKSKKYDRQLAESIGLGIQPELRAHASLICQLQAREAPIELELRRLMKDVRFLPYRKVFALFGFGERVQALILSQIYPLENYLLDGRPEVIIRKGKVSGKPTKRHKSRARFQKALGVAPVREESGDKKKKKKAVSSLCRTALWQWVHTRIEVQRCQPRSEIAQALCEEYYQDKEVHRKPTKLVRSRLYSRAVSKLFYELVRAIAE